MLTIFRGGGHYLPTARGVREFSTDDELHARPLVDLTAQIHDPIRCGGGAYGDVFKCQLSDSSSLVAVKSIRYFTDDEETVERLKKVLRRELELWRRLGEHPNIVPLLGIAKNFGPVDAPVSPWMTNSTLHSFMKGEGRTQALHERVRMLKGIGSGLAYLHSKGVVHGDLTSSNILIDEVCNPKLIDFGLASAIGALQPDQSYLFRHSSAVGAIRWMAPEILSGKGLKPAADVYSFGCVMLEVLSGQVPYQGESDARVIWLKVKENKIPDRPACAGFEAKHWTLMARCWSSPQKRPTAREVVVMVTELVDSKHAVVISSDKSLYIYTICVFFWVFD